MFPILYLSNGDPKFSLQDEDQSLKQSNNREVIGSHIVSITLLFLQTNKFIYLALSGIVSTSSN